MFTIEKIVISRFGQSSVTIADLGSQEMTVRLSTEQAIEVEKLVREMLATELRRPMLEEKLEAAKAISPMAPPPAEIKTPTGTASFTPDGYKPDKPAPGVICPIHNVAHDLHQDCPMCAEIASGFAERSRGMTPSDRLDDDIPF